MLKPMLDSFRKLSGLIDKILSTRYSRFCVWKKNIGVVGAA